MQIAEGRSDNSLQENEQTKASERPFCCVDYLLLRVSEVKSQSNGLYKGTSSIYIYLYRNQVYLYGFDLETMRDLGRALSFVLVISLEQLYK